MKSVKEQVHAKQMHQINHHAYERVDSQIWIQVWRQFYGQTRSQPNDQVVNHVHDQVWNLIK
jgi:hypothetical protein